MLKFLYNEHSMFEASVEYDDDIFHMGNSDFFVTGKRNTRVKILSDVITSNVNNISQKIKIHPRTDAQMILRFIENCEFRYEDIIIHHCEIETRIGDAMIQIRKEYDKAFITSIEREKNFQNFQNFQNIMDSWAL